nr:ribonuclease H-like domain-containing protein [Tanacetum cinerariifolium]
MIYGARGWNLWEVIVNGDSVLSVESTSAEGPIPPKTAKQKLARKNELKAKSTLMLAIPDEHLLKFHACKDAKSLWEAIKNMFGGNKESKKMQKTIFKQNYEKFAATSQEGLDKTYDSSKDQASTASYTDDVMFFFFSNQSNAQQLDNKDLKPIDTNDLKEMDLKWQVAIHTMRVKRLDNFVFKSKVSETITSVPKIETNASKTSKDSLEKPKTVRSSAPLIEEYESDSEDENVFEPKELPRKFSQSPRGNKRNWNALMTQKLGDGFEFNKKACFVYGSINHLIKDCEFCENKMVMNNKGKITGPKEIRPVWDNTARVNHQNRLTRPHPKRNFIPATVLTKSGQVPVNAAKQSSHRAAASISAARHVNTAASRPNVNNEFPITYSYFKAHSPVRRPFNKKSAAKTNNFNEKVNTAKVSNVTTAGSKAVVSAAEGNRNDGNPQYALQDQGIFDSGCSTHITKNKSYLPNYQEINGGFVAFRGNAKEGRKPALSFMRPFGCPVTILNTLDHLGNQTNGNAGTKGNIDAGQVGKKIVSGPQYVLLPLLTSDSQGPKSSEDKVADDAGKKSTEVP